MCQKMLLSKPWKLFLWVTGDNGKSQVRHTKVNYGNMVLLFFHVLSSKMEKGLIGFKHPVLMFPLPSKYVAHCDNHHNSLQFLIKPCCNN